MKKRKVTIYLSDQEYETINNFAKSLDVPFTTAGVTAIKLGIASIDLARNPKLKKFFESQTKELDNELNL
jgi:hypothetical protein